MEPIAYLHCELKSRDFESRLLIAAELVRMGYPVVVGQQWGIYGNVMHTAPPVGAHLFATANSAQAAVMQACRAQGRAVVASDQEAPPFRGDGLLANVSAEALAASHLVLAQNARHAEILRSAHPAAAGRVRVAGNARIDALRAATPERPMAGPYIVINTGFGLINSVWGNLDEALAALANAAGIDPKTPEGKRELEERVSVERAVHREVTALIAQLADNGKAAIVVRPHPSENPELWRKDYAGKSGVTIVAGSDPIAWTKHALLVVHGDSTTGLEAAILGVPCLNLAPDPRWSGRFIMSEINVTVSNAAAAKERIDRLLAGQGWPAPSIPADLFPPDAALATAREIASLLPPPGATHPQRWAKVQRSDVQRAKFTVDQQDLFRLLGPIAQRLDRRMSVHALDDSIFLMIPAA